MSVPLGRQGTELSKLLVELGIKAGCGCGCDEWVRKMDEWGAEGCQEHREEILAHLREQYAKLGWFKTLEVMARAVASGLVFQLDPMDPASGLLDEAIRRAAGQK